MTTVAHVTAPAQFGGLERVVSGLALETAARGHNVILVMALSPHASLPSWAEDLREAGVLLEPLRLSSRDYLGERRAVRRILERHRVQVVHTHGYRSDVLHLGVARSMRLPIVSTAHGFASTGGRGRVYEWLQLHAWRGFDAVVAVSVPLMQTLRDAGVSSDRLVMIRNGFVATGAPLLRLEARARLGLPVDAPIIGWVGRMSEEKNPLLAVEALSCMKNSRALLCMVGDGPQRVLCAARARELGISDRVDARGARSDAAQLLAAFDLLLLSSRTEGTPMVILEAAMAGVPIVATRVGGVPDLLGADGLVVASDDVSALAGAADESLERTAQSAARASSLRSRLTEMEAREDWVGAYLALYERCVRQRSTD